MYRFSIMNTSVTIQAIHICASKHTEKKQEYTTHFSTQRGPEWPMSQYKQH